MIRQIMDSINQCDPEVGATIESELTRQKRNIELIASENLVSEAVMVSHGHLPDQQVCRGLSRQTLLRRLRDMSTSSRASPASVRASSLAPSMPTSSPTPAHSANLAVFFAAARAGRHRAWAWSLAYGGHLTHGSPVNISGKLLQHRPLRAWTTRPSASTTTRCRPMAKEAQP